jgi:uncharacterized protein
MKIVWGEIKHRTNLHKHGMDFADIDLEFFARATIFPSKIGRLAAVGNISGIMATVIFTRLGSEAISIISMRAASAKERDKAS